MSNSTARMKRTAVITPQGLFNSTVFQLIWNILSSYEIQIFIDLKKPKIHGLKIEGHPVIEGHL